MKREEKSKHFLPPENIQDNPHQNEHEDEQAEPSPPLILERQGHVHAIETRHQGRRHQEHRHKREYLHYVVLIQVDKTQNGFLEVFQPLKAEIGVVDQGGDVLKNDRETSLKLRRVLVTLDHVLDQPLLIYDILPDYHRVLLELVDVQEEVLVDVFLLVYPLAVLGNLLAHELDHVSVEVYSLVHDAHEHREAAGIHLWLRHYPALKLGERAERNVAERREAIIHECERDGLHGIVLRARHQEVRVGEYRVLSL